MASARYFAVRASKSSSLILPTLRSNSRSLSARSTARFWSSSVRGAPMAYASAPVSGASPTSVRTLAQNTAITATSAPPASTSTAAGGPCT